MEAEADVTPTSLRPIKWPYHAGLVLLFFPVFPVATHLGLKR
jgi:hypothetical protein